MTTNCIVLHEGLTVKDAMNELVRQAEENDNMTTLLWWTTDCFYGGDRSERSDRGEERCAAGKSHCHIVPHVYANETIDDCIEQLKDYSEDLIPVLDNQNKLLGVITAQSLIDVVDEEMGEDYAKLAGLTAEEDLNEPLKQSVKKRLPWLLSCCCWDCWCRWSWVHSKRWWHS
ncbi:MAG: CBS domain-containing protein [Ruminococcus callidus]